MKSSQLIAKLFVGILAFGLAGCHCCDKSRTAAPPPVVVPPPPTSSSYLVPNPSAAPYRPLPQAPGEAPGIRFAVPQNGEEKGEIKQSVQLYPPESSEPPRAGAATAPSDTAKAAGGSPTGLPRFALVTESPRAASGLKPFADGWDWLKANNYHAVLHIKLPGADDASDREAALKRGLKFTSLEVSPETLSNDLVKKFSALVSDNANAPIYVYDEDGVHAGGMWYLHFLQTLKQPEPQARKQASQLGLKDDPAGDQGTLWVAIQKLLGQ